MGITTISSNAGASVVAAGQSVNTQKNDVQSNSLGHGDIQNLGRLNNEINKNVSNNESKEDANQLKNKPEKESLQKIADNLNDFMDAINTDIEFKLHTGTERLMVEVVDKKTNKVLKEYPDHELLDVVARLQNMVGALMDQKI